MYVEKYVICKKYCLGLNNNIRMKFVKFDKLHKFRFEFEYFYLYLDFEVSIVV